jgi:hypothetical protein
MPANIFVFQYPTDDATKFGLAQTYRDGINVELDLSLEYIRGYIKGAGSEKVGINIVPGFPPVTSETPCFIGPQLVPYTSLEIAPQKLDLEKMLGKEFVTD